LNNVQHFKNVCFHIRQADTLGFHAAIFLTGHYGPNWQDLKSLLALLQPHVGARLYGLPDFKANTPGFDHDGKSGGNHAGRVETSLLWAVEPACVDISRLPSRDTPGLHFAMGSNAYDAHRAIGERMVADEAQWLGEKARELLAACEAEQPRHTLRTFEQVEQLWETLIRPELQNFRSMQPLQDGQLPPAEGSVWHVNWHVPDQS
jgi:creatinine amidohydrolase